MNGLRRIRPSSGQVALVISVIALVFAIVGTAFSGGSKVPGKNGVKASDIAKGAVRGPKIANGAVSSSKIADGAVTSGKVFLSAVSPTSFGTLLAGDCASIGIPAPGIQATDHVVVTPPPSWADTFTVVGHPNPNTSEVRVAACNQFSAGGADPEQGDSVVRVLVIR
jgi:hypothetical protein